MKFSYQAYDKSGALKSGTIEAPSKDDANEQLRKKGLFVSSLAEGQGSATSSAGKSKKRKGSAKISTKAVAEFARELSVLISTGTPLIDAISSIERQSSSEAWSKVLREVISRLEEGDSLTSAMESRTDVFDAVFRSLVAAGESSGHLDAMLQRVAVLTRKQAQIKANLTGAMMYPILLIGIAVIVMGLLIGVVLPRFAGMFETLDTELPASTALLMMVSDFVRAYWWGVIPALIFGLVMLVRWIKSPAGGQTLSVLALGVPKLGDIQRSFMTARITRLMGVLLEAKVPMIDSIELTRESLGNPKYIELLDRAERAVTKGEPISSSFNKGDLMIPSAVEAIRNGEQTGRLAEVMLHISDYLDEDNETIVKSASSLIEPVIMVGLGLLVGFVAISMFLPLFDLTAAAGGGAP
ncbi:MAG: type II secretion system F family protein [Phycisphaerales bacterium]|nr:type II secretion system F family protein [Phycisphaerales bacterium]